MTREEARDRIRAGLPVIDYLKKSKYGNYCCPVCNSGNGRNHTGAVKVYQDTNTWHCHACNAGGDIFDLLQAINGTDYNGALEAGANALGITIDGARGPQSGKTADLSHEKMTDNNSYLNGEKVQQNDPQEPQDAPPPIDNTAYYKECAARLLQSPEALAYMNGRGISTDTLKRHYIGFDPAADPAGSGHPAPRIIIPTTEAHYIGRSIDPNTPKAFAKLNNKGASPGLFNVKALYLNGNGPVFITEGAIDAMSIEEAGGAAVGLNSTANAKTLVKQLEQRPTTASLIISLDTDAAGRKRSGELLQDLQGIGVECIERDICGSYKDPNEALCRDPEQLRAAVAAAQAAVDPLDAFLKTIQTRHFEPHKTGLPFFDDLLSGGMIDGTTMILTAPPAAGKTTLCLQLAAAMANKQTPVVYLNLEMSNEQMLAKAISCKLAAKDKYYNATKILQGYNWSETDKRNIGEAIEEYRKTTAPYLSFKPQSIGNSLEEILEYLNNLGEAAEKKGGHAPVVILDYLHIIETPSHYDIKDSIGKIVYGAKRYADNHKTVAILISAQNRESTKRKNPSMTDARDSSNIEFSADYLLSLQAVDKEDREPKRLGDRSLQRPNRYRRMKLFLLKNRFGPCNIYADINFDAAANYFLPEQSPIPFEDDEEIPGQVDITQIQTPRKRL